MPKRSEKRDTAKAEYIAKKKKGEEVSLRALAGELGVSYQTLRNWKAADKWEEALPKKKRGGQPGNQNSKGKRNAAGSHDGAPPGNKNAEKDGAYSAVFFDMLSAEELKITESVPLGGREALEHEMKILKFREHKILAKIAEYESQPEDALFVSSLLDVLIVLEDDDLREHSAHWEAGAKQNFDTGLYTAHTILYIRVEDYGPKPKIGKQLVLDKGTKSQRTYTINLCQEESGVYRMTMERTRQ